MQSTSNSLVFGVNGDMWARLKFGGKPNDNSQKTGWRPGKDWDGFIQFTVF